MAVSLKDPAANLLTAAQEATIGRLVFTDPGSRIVGYSRPTHHRYRGVGICPIVLRADGRRQRLTPSGSLWKVSER